MELKAGEKLGPYEIVSRLGVGGMGEVWRARDPRLNRDVAIKVSAQQFTDRFEREAHAIAALNHTNICTLFDIGPNYLVMELIEGPTLAERIAEGAIPVEETLAIARQIADAIEAAHEKGIVHRDLKPGNVKIRPDGSVKVLDFGLAKDVFSESKVTSDSPTLVAMPTQIGVILGTAAYMAPEQARGKVVDKRADIWSFGVVLHEMLTGKRLFEGEDLTETLASVVKSEPDISAVPVQVKRLLTKCLQKDPKKRLRDIGDAWDFLGAEESVTAPSQSPLGMRIATVAAAIAIVVAAGVAFVHFRETPPETPLLRYQIEPPDKTTFGGAPAVSPDGRHVAFSAGGKLWVRALDSLAAQPLNGTEGEGFPFWSPDSKSIGFFSSRKIRRIDIAGGPPLALADYSQTAGATWSSEGTIVFAPSFSGILMKISASGGTPVPVTKLDSAAKETSHYWPQFLPDGKHFLFVASNGTRTTIRVGSLDSPEIRTLAEADSFAVYALCHLLFLRGGTLMAQAFDTKRLALAGDAVPVAQQVGAAGMLGYGYFSASANGMLVYWQGVPATQSQLTWFDRAGKSIGALGEPAIPYTRMELSPDRKKLAISLRESSSGNVDIWIFDVARGLRTRFTFDPASEADAVWSPDGNSIVFNSTRNGTSGIYRKRADGAGPEELLYADARPKYPMSWSPDGKALLYLTTSDPKTAGDLWILPDPFGPPGASKPYTWLQTPYTERHGQFSPDGKWIACESNESGRFEVYVAPFAGPGGKRQISVSGGTVPRWRRDGHEIFYYDPGGMVMAAEMTEKGGTIEVGETHKLFGPVPTGAWYDVSADGKQFLERVPEQSNASTPITVIQNWTAALKK